MLSVEVITLENAVLHRDLMDEHHRVRHEIFVEERKWQDMKTVDGRERDQFDTPQTIYLLVVDDETLVGGCRMHPSEGPTLLSEIFPHLAAVRGFERAPDVYEVTRGFVVRSHREEKPMRVSGAWKAAIFEVSLAMHIRSFNGVGETWFIPGLRQLGWQVRFLGLPQQEGEFDLVAFNTTVTEDALHRMREHYSLPAPITSWRGIARRPSDQPAAVVWS